jgi:alpha-galactosidase
MSLELTSDHARFHLRIPEGRWDIAAQPGQLPNLEGLSLSLTWRSGARRLTWDGAMRAVSNTDITARESPHGCLTCASIDLDPQEVGIALQIEFALACESPLALWRIQLRNVSPRPIRLETIEMMRLGSMQGRWTPDWVRRNLPRKPGDTQGALRLQTQTPELALHTQGWQSWTYAGTLGADERAPQTRLGPFIAPIERNASTRTARRRGVHVSDMFGVVGDRSGRRGILVGFLSQRDAFGWLEARLDPHTPYLSLRADGDRARIDPGHGFTSDWACIQFVDLDAPVPLAPYLEAVARENVARNTSPVPVGWCSWYYLFQGVTQNAVEDNLSWLDAHRSEMPMELIQIDDGYQVEVGDWLDVNGEAFPDGMAAIAARIRAAGFKPGIWLAPFVAKPGAQILRDHPEWVLRNRLGTPVNPGFIWDTFSRALDLTHPDVLAYVRRVVENAVQTWGYEYLKLDFLYAGALPGRRYDPTRTRAQALSNAFAVIRTAAGERTTLAGCGCPLGTGVGTFDTMRIGPDVAPNWRPSYRRLTRMVEDEAGMPGAWNAIRTTVGRAAWHRRWWVNDPDCLLIRSTNTQLSAPEVQSLATVIAMSAGTLMVSDALPELSEERIAWLSRLLPPLPGAGTVLDWFDSISPARLALPLYSPAGIWLLLALFNWQDEQADLEVELASLPLPPATQFHLLDFWQGNYDRVQDPVLRFPEVPPHGVRLVSIRPVLEAPQWVGDTLHISQGLAVQNLGIESNQMIADLNLGRRARGTVWLALPVGPSRVTLEGQPVPWRQVTKGIYSADLDFAGPSSLKIQWS